MIQPGGTIGILGGGQLGRMLAMSAAQLGYRVLAYAPEDDAVIAQVCNEYIGADWHDAEALRAFADACDIVTLEFENVPAAPLEAIADKLAPHPRALAIAQDRLRSFIERIERLEEEKTALMADIKEVYSEAKGTGFDIKTMRKVISLRKMEESDRQEAEFLLDTYLSALGMLDRPTESAQAAE